MTWRSVRALPIMIMTALPSMTAVAVEFKHAEPPFVPDHNCTCRFNGEDVPLHQRRCLATPQGRRTAECVLEQNVTSWRPTGDECPQASRFMPRG